MKRYDSIIIASIFVIIIISFFIFNKTNIDNNIIQIIVNNEVIDEININNQYEYIIESNNDTINIYKTDLNNKKIISIKKVQNKSNKNIYNHIVINNRKINMTESNCKGKDCMHMEINENKQFPIICTNGIIIKYVYNRTY